MTDQSRFVAVVDGGGTSTRAALARPGSGGSWQVVGRGVAGASNPSVVGIVSATESIAEAWQQAVAASGLGVATTDRAVIALAGALREDIRGPMMESLMAIELAREIRVVPDLLPILYTAHSNGQGVGVIAGTGSVAFAQDEEGRLTVRGGWGYLLGDEGSGYWLGREAIRRLLDRRERGHSPDGLDRGLLRHLGAESIDGIKRAIYGSDDPRRAIAGVAPLVVAAEHDEPAASELLTRCADGLARLVEGLAADQHGPFPLAASGGLLTGSRVLASRFEQAITARYPSAKVLLVSDPLEGCLALSREEEFRRPIVLADGASF